MTKNICSAAQSTGWKSASSHRQKSERAQVCQKYDRLGAKQHRYGVKAAIGGGRQACRRTAESQGRGLSFLAVVALVKKMRVFR
eukprot:493660-Prymnesium_polylepis.1